MFTLKISYNDESENFEKELREALKNITTLDIISYHENLTKERKKAFSLKHIWGTKKSPFALLIDEESNPVTAFYSDNNRCTVFEIERTLHSIIPYGVGSGTEGSSSEN